MSGADLVGGAIYWNGPTQLYTVDPTNLATNQLIGSFGLAGSMLDIALDHSGTLYGVNDGGQFVSINQGTGAATVLATGVGSSQYSLASHGVGDFYASDYPNGNLYDWHWNGATLTSTLIGSYNDADGEGSFSGVGVFSSGGDLWAAQDGTVYSTVRGGSTGYLVTVDPTNAEVDYLATLNSTQYLGLAQSSGTGSDLLVMHQNGTIQTWNGSTLSVLGDIGNVNVYGATGVVPVPGAFLLGSLGLGIATWRLRKRRES